MNITASQVKELRNKTGAGMMDCKNALVHSDGEINKAIDYLRKTGVSKAEKKGSRDTKEGLVYSYIHAGGKLGVIIELNCETDFVASNIDFKNLAHDLSMHIAATNPLSINKDAIDQSIVEREKEIYTEQAKSEGKPDKIIEKMVNGRLSKFFQETCLLEQTFIKDQEKRVSDLITESISKLGENITIRRFIRYAIGEDINFNKSFI
ncbi:MAG: translation elongation factor Ts [Candidatus Neomarinimicrobiota bacterium]